MESKTILVIEDNPVNMKLVRSLLQIGKHTIFEADEAQSGIELAREHKPDLILMDIQLPGMDGLMATRIIKEDSALKDIPVVALTAHAMQGDEEKIMDAGCDGYITKPVDTRNFLKSINQYLRMEKGQSPSARAKTTAFKHKVLIVDDEPVNVKLLAAKLSSNKFEIIRAYNGREALEQVGQHNPDVILLDIMMPELDGYEVTRRLKTDIQTRDIPIIMVTALDGIEDKIKGLEFGAEEFLTKPVNTAELQARIHSMLRLKQYKDQLNVRTQTEQSLCNTGLREEICEEPVDSPKILLVEDSEKDAKLILSYFNGHKHDVTTITTGKEAIDFVEKEKVDLILLDILLPDIDGFEICERLKKNERTRNIQIIVITCLRDLENKIKGIELGADDYLIKPINSRELRTRVNVLLKKKSFIDKLNTSYAKALNSAVIDGLTGLYNHRYVKRYIELEIKRSERYGYPIALFMIDIDNFKHYNDTLGHLEGDRILQNMSEVIRKNIRETDLAARYGGEEFVIVLPYIDKESALSVAERIRKVIAESSLNEHFSDPIENITVSIGIAACPSDSSSPEELLQKADQMLYRAKSEGKNRVCISDKGNGE